MAIGKRLIIQGCVTFGFALLLLCVAPPKIFYNTSTDLHSSPSTNVMDNSTLRQASSSTPPEHELGLRACICETCAYPLNCQCLCTKGWRVETPVTCQDRRYPSLAKALSRGVPAGLCSKAEKRPQWEIAFESVQRLLSDLVQGRWSLQDFAACSTFAPPLVPSSDLRDSCQCYISPQCSRKCQGVEEEGQDL